MVAIILSRSFSPSVCRIGGRCLNGLGLAVSLSVLCRDNSAILVSVGLGGAVSTGFLKGLEGAVSAGLLNIELFIYNGGNSYFTYTILL